MHARFALLATVLISGSTSALDATAQEVFVRDLKCRAAAISACVADIKQRSCQRGSTSFTGAVCQGPYTDTPDEVNATSCGEKIDNLQAGTCLVPVNLQTLINSSGILAELKETNRILREDQRALLTQFCRSYAPKPESCEAMFAGAK
ncbi:hypothetical protein [Bosea sp. ANAM02]|uniref:hypothetical protein n=1 Tax=Bosea sp. ANAM02 TaxID=2020412 RepID=UPI00140EEC10|nr:hypothetical protein [Bosea sp. ANAM02]BCB22248.1 hypothetical protein OCUBac02_51420 [Bosea sp. ANAM02]